jgi:hypothetical protein
MPGLTRRWWKCRDPPPNSPRQDETGSVVRLDGNGRGRPTRPERFRGFRGHARPALAGLVTFDSVRGRADEQPGEQTWDLVASQVWLCGGCAAADIPNRFHSLPVGRR